MQAWWRRPRRTTRCYTCAPSPPYSSFWCCCACCVTASDDGVDGASTAPCSCPSRRARPGGLSTCARSSASATPAWTVFDGGFNSQGTFCTPSSYGYCRRQQYAHFTGSLGRVVYVLSSYIYRTNSTWPTVLLFVTYINVVRMGPQRPESCFVYAKWPPFDCMLATEISVSSEHESVHIFLIIWVCLCGVCGVDRLGNGNSSAVPHQRS